MITDFIFQHCIEKLESDGVLLKTRNAVVKSVIDMPVLTFGETPLVTCRKTAWKKAIEEMEWFLSGMPKCPAPLAETWWKGQLSPEGFYWGGYGKQLRLGDYHNYQEFDQIQYLIDGLKNNPNSRRLLLTTWNPWEMANITRLNENPNTPTTCHTTVAQFFVREGSLFMKSYQRSADVLLGVPHNWIQSWALLLWLAHKANLGVGSMQWIFGDLHLYQEESHVETARQIAALDVYPWIENSFKLIYEPTDDWFMARDFHMEGEIPEPQVFTKPKLL
jgi:thymidylate synthase